MAIFKKLFDQIREWLGVVPKKIREYSSRSLEITSKIKNLLGGPLGDAVVNIIPGTWDDSVRTLLLGYLNEAIPYLQIVDTSKAYSGCIASEAGCIAYCLTGWKTVENVPVRLLYSG